MVSTDRISAYDVVMPNGIPNKGAILNQISEFWFNLTSHIVPNHLIHIALDDENIDAPSKIKRRAMLVHEANRIDVECVARGYITGSALEEYESSGCIAGLAIPPGMVEGDKFNEPIFTPATKAEEGHDENITLQQMSSMVGSDLANRLKLLTLEIYEYAHDYALKKGIIIADTKMEFGLINNEIHLIDELLTPDSSRFWDASGYKPGKSQPNFDKQFVRDWLNSQKWDREPPAPILPQEIISKTSVRYEEAFNKLVGTQLR
tara:strand:+ start:1358 stop:2143 length:786 start_codon:yes stop_codon:yes gene_type:complete